MMTVNTKTAHRCCTECDVDFGSSKNGKAKKALRRTIKRRDRQDWKKNI
jgi:hypothetical protein